MAEMIPESISGKSVAEELVFDTLKRLPDDFFVYYEPMVSDRCPDFIVISPDLGVFVIEVKGWALRNLVQANDEEVKLRDGDRVVSHINPVKQARNYMFAVMDECRKHPEFSELCHAEGRYEGRYLFPFGHVVFLARIRAQELHSSSLANVFRPEHVVTRDAMESWKHLDEQRIKNEIKQYFSVNWDFPRLSLRQVDILRSAIHPDIVVTTTPVEASTSAHDHGREEEKTPESIKILDWHQEKVARRIGRGHRILNGVAGSGKTVLLLHRARWLSAQDPNAKILVLCYNRGLSAFLRSELEGCKNVTVSTFHGWAHTLKAKSAKDLDKFGQNVLACAEKLRQEQKYHAILIDEAQDFHRSWFQSVVASLKDEEDGDLLIVADGNQGLYRPKEFRWIDVGVQARGRVIPLRTNYRNTDEIMNFAWTFAAEGEEDLGESIVSIKPVRAIRSGPLPFRFRADNREQEVEKIVELVSGLLAGEWPFMVLSEPLKPSDIGIIYPRVPDKFMWKMFFTLKESLEKLCPVVWPNDKKDPKGKDKVMEPGLKILTIDTAKGLQYKAAILMWTDLLPSDLPKASKEVDRRKLYVALTRAQDYLAVTYTGESEFTKQIQDHFLFSFTFS